MRKKQKRFYKKIVTFMLVMIFCSGIILDVSPVYAAGDTAIQIDLNNRSKTDNVSFKVSNMFPGDIVSNIYRVEVPNLKDSESATVHFQAVIREGYEKLAEVLQCEVVLEGTEEVLYTGLMRDMSVSANGVLYNPKDAYLDYEIRVWLDKKVGNEYQGKTLVADFIWWVEETAQRIEVDSLDEVPEGLQNTPFNTVEKIKSELNRVLIAEGGSGYSTENMAFYDVRLQFWNGSEWIDATEENFPLEGINVTLPYPEETAKDTHDFTVSHMFTVDSDRLCIRAGEVEYPPVTKTEAGLNVTFKGLSPVAVAWKELLAEEVPEELPEDKIPEESTASKEDSAENTSAKDAPTGDTAPVTGYICLMLSAVAGLLLVTGMRKKCKEYGDE